MRKQALMRLLAAELSDYDPETGSQVKSFIEHYTGMDRDDWKREEFNNKIKQTGDMWGAIPHLSHPDAERKKAGLKERYAAAYNKLKELTKHNDLTLYRGLATTEEVIDRIIKGERFDLGKHWTLNPRLAKDFASPNAAGPVGLIITGTADVSGINILKTLRQMIQFPEEQEVQLEYGTPITVEKIEMRQGGLYHHDDMIKLQEKVKNIDPSGMKFIASSERTANKIEDYDPINGDPRKIAQFILYKIVETGNQSYKRRFIEEFKKTRNPWVLKDTFVWFRTLYDKYVLAYRDLKKKFNNNEMHVFRGLHIDYADLAGKVSTLDKFGTLADVGTHWTTEEVVALSYSRSVYSNKPIGILLVGVVSANSVDMFRTLTQTMNFPDEFELRLGKTTPITLTEIQLTSIYKTELDKKVKIKKLVDDLAELLQKEKRQITASVGVQAEDPNEYDPKRGNIYRVFDVLSKYINPIIMSAYEEDRKIIIDHIAQCKDKGKLTYLLLPPGAEYPQVQKVQWYNLYISRYIERFSQLKRKMSKPFKVYRGLHQIDEHTFQAILGGTQHLGKYWSTDKDISKNFAINPPVTEDDDANPEYEYNEDFTEIMLTGIVEPADINWFKTLQQRMDDEIMDEDEIRLDPDTPINLVDVQFVNSAPHWAKNYTRKKIKQLLSKSRHTAGKTAADENSKEFKELKERIERELKFGYANHLPTLFKHVKQNVRDNLKDGIINYYKDVEKKDISHLKDFDFEEMYKNFIYPSRMHAFGKYLLEDKNFMWSLEQLTHDELNRDEEVPLEKPKEETTEETPAEDEEDDPEIHSLPEEDRGGPLSTYHPKKGKPKEIASVIARVLYDDLGPTAARRYKSSFDETGKKDPFPKDQDSDINNIYVSYKAVYEELEQQIEGGRIEIYRGMHVRIDELLNLKNENTHLGIYWSYRRQSAKTYEEDTAIGSVSIVMQGSVEADSVDWGVSIIHNMSRSFAHENEIRVPKGTPIKLLAVDVIDIIDQQSAAERLRELDLLPTNVLKFGREELDNYDMVDGIIDDNPDLLGQVSEIYADTFIENFDIKDIYYKDKLSLYFMVQEINPIAQILMREIPGDKWTEIAYDPEKALPYFLAAEKDIIDFLKRSDSRDVIEEFRDKYHFNDLFEGSTEKLKDSDVIYDIQNYGGQVDEEFIQKLINVEFKHEYTAKKNNS